MGSDQVSLPASFFTMGHPKTVTGLESYFRNIRDSFSNVGRICKKNALAIVVVAFSEKRTQFSPFMDAMRDAGFSEIKNITASSEGRIWREVPNRRWYNNLGRTTAAKLILRQDE